MRVSIWSGPVAHLRRPVLSAEMASAQVGVLNHEQDLMTCLRANPSMRCWWDRATSKGQWTRSTKRWVIAICPTTQHARAFWVYEADLLRRSKKRQLAV